MSKYEGDVILYGVDVTLAGELGRIASDLDRRLSDLESRDKLRASDIPAPSWRLRSISYAGLGLNEPPVATPKPREPGWYWAQFDGLYGMVPAIFEGQFWLKPDGQICTNPPVKIGPRIQEPNHE